MRTRRQLCAALLLSQETELTRQLPDVLDRNGDAEDGTGPEAGAGRGSKTNYQLDAASADLLRPGYRRRNGCSNQFAVSPGMSARGDGVSIDQSSARLPDLRSGRRMPAS